MFPADVVTRPFKLNRLYTWNVKAPRLEGEHYGAQTYFTPCLHCVTLIPRVTNHTTYHVYAQVFCNLLKHPVVTLCSTRLNTQNFYILTTGHLCVLPLHGSRNKQRLFRYSIIWLVLTTETECVYCAVWTESLNNGEINTSCYMFVSSKQSA